MNFVMVRLSVMMLLQYAIWGSWSTALTPYLLKLGFSGDQIGAVFSALWIACMIAPAIGGQLADRLMPTQIFLGLAHLGGALTLWQASTAATFSSLWPWMFGYSLLYAPTLALTNSLAFHHLEDASRQFGRIRLWGTIGWILAGLAVTAARETWHTAEWIGRSDLLMFAAVLSVVMGVYCFTLPSTPPRRESPNPFAFLEALSMLKDRNFLVFLLCSFVVTTELQFYYVPTPQFLLDNGISNDRIPAALTLAQVAEILVLLLLLHLSLRKFGIRKTMVIGILAWPLRYFLFTIPSLPVILASLTLHGFGYAFFFVASQIYVDRKAAGDMRASAQALLAFFTLGLGNTFGSFFTGRCMELFKQGDTMAWTPFFLVPAAITVAAALAFVLLFKDDVKLDEKAGRL